VLSKTQNTFTNLTRAVVFLQYWFRDSIGAFRQLYDELSMQYVTLCMLQRCGGCGMLDVAGGHNTARCCCCCCCCWRWRSVVKEYQQQTTASIDEPPASFFYDIFNSQCARAFIPPFHTVTGASLSGTIGANAMNLEELEHEIQIWPLCYYI